VSKAGGEILGEITEKMKKEDLGGKIWKSCKK